jgi:hypothetical protein
MRNLLTSDLVLKSGFLCVPLLFDPEMEREVAGRRAADVLVETNGRLFVKALSLRSLLENYERLDPEGYRELSDPRLQGSRAGPHAGDIPIGGKLETILSGVLPRFVRRRKGRPGRRSGPEDILDLIADKVRIPARYIEEAAGTIDAAALRRRLRDLEGRDTPVNPPDEGPISWGDLREWIRRVLSARMAEREKDRLMRMLERRESGAGAAEGNRLALRLYIAAEGSLEIDGFGISRIGATDDYIAYKRTGEYALKDYYGRLYLFPDCRVGVATIVPLRPFVMESYKHPFLEGTDPGQPICLRAFQPSRVFTAAGMIRALEEGIGALLHGYSSRRRNGYHSLDRTTLPLWVAEPDDGDPWPPDYPVVRSRLVPDVDFEDYRVPKDHPGIVSGEVEVTNDLMP